MVFKKAIVGARVIYVDESQEVAFNKTIWDEARGRFQSQLVDGVVVLKNIEWEKIIVGARVFYINYSQEVSFNKSEWDEGKEKYKKETYKKLVELKKHG